MFPHAALNYLQGFAAGFLAFVTIKGSASLTRVLGAVCFPGVMMMYSLALEFTSMLLYVQGERMDYFRDGEHRTANTAPELCGIGVSSSSSILLYVHRDHNDC